MSKTKVPGGYIDDGSITSSHLHSSHGITTDDIGQGSNNKYYTDAQVDTRLAATKSSNFVTTGNIQISSDTGELKLGAGPDLFIKHDGSNSYIENYTGHLYIKNRADDKDVLIQTDDGSGGVATYMTFDGSNTNIAVAKTMVFADSTKASFGAAEDLRISHGGTDSNITNHTGDLYIRQHVDDKDILFQSDDGSGGVTTYFFLDGSQANTNFQKDIIFADSKKALFGGSGDLQIYHNGSNSFITENGTGSLFIDSDNTIHMRNVAGNSTMAQFTPSGAVTLYHNGSSKLVTASGGISVTGALTASTNLEAGSSSFLRFVAGSSTTPSILFGDSSGTGGTLSFKRNADSAVAMSITATGTLTATALAGTLSTAAQPNITSVGTLTSLTSGDISIEDGVTPKLTINDTGNAGGGGASGKIMFRNTAGDAMGIGYTSNSTADSDMIISTNAGGTYGGYLGLAANGITDAQSDIILEPKTNVRIATGSIEMGTTAFIDQSRNMTVGTIDSGNITSTGSINMNHDSAALYLGADIDLRLTHNGSSGTLRNDTGDFTIDAAADIVLDAGGAQIRFHDDGTDIGVFSNESGNFIIKPQVSDADLIFKGNDGGSTITALTLDMSDAGTATFNHDVVIGGNLTVSGDTITANVATLDVEDKNITLNKGSGDTSSTADGAGITIQDAVNSSTDASLTWNAAGDKFIFSHKLRMFGTLELPDNVKLVAGDGEDLQIYHNGNNSFIEDAGTGDLYIRGADSVRIQSYSDNEDMIKAIKDGAVELYHNNVKTFETTSTGVKVQGPNGHATMGASNTSGFHIYTDRDRFYFNKKISLITDTITSYDADFQLQRNETTKVTIGASAVNFADAIQVGGTTVIDSSRNLSNIGTISSGAITTSGAVITGDDVVLPNNKDVIFKKADGTDDGTKITRATGNAFRFKYTANSAIFDALGDNSFQVRNSNDAVVFQVVPNSTLSSSYTDVINQLRLGGTVVINSSRNLVNIGTISSGAISSTGTFTTTGSSITVDPASGDAVLALQGAAGAQTLRLDQNSIRSTTSSDISIFTSGHTRQLFLDQSSGHVGIHMGSNVPSEALELQDGNIKIDGLANANTRGLIIKHTGQTGNEVKLENVSNGVYGRLHTTERRLIISAASDGGAGSSETLDLYTNGTRRIKIAHNGPITFNEAYTFPTSDGSSGQVLKTDGSGNLTFGTISGGTGKVDVGSGFSANRVLTAANSDTADGEANLTFDGSTLTVTGAVTSSGTIAFSPAQGNDLTLGNDSTYGTSGSGRYVTLGFGGVSNGSNRIFAHNTGGDGLYLNSATGQSIIIRTNGSGTNKWIFKSDGALAIGSGSGTELIDSSRNFKNMASADSLIYKVDGKQFVYTPNNNPVRGPYNPVLESIRQSGKPLTADEDFNDGSNSVSVYNNAGGGVVTHSRVTATDEGFTAPNSSGKVIKIVHNGGTSSPGFGGFVQSYSSAANRIIVQIFVAKLPVGRSLQTAQNSQGSNPTNYFLTSTAGTGKFETYVRVANNGDSGTFSSGGHVYVSGGSGGFTWYLASCQAYIVTSREMIGARQVAASLESSSPAFIRHGDTDTGVCFPGSDQVGLTVGNSRKLHINSTTASFQNLSTGVNIASGALQIAGTNRINSVGDGLFTSLYIGGTNVIDTSRNLTNIATATASSFVGTGTYHELGNNTGAVSNDGSWHARLNISGTSHARLDLFEDADDARLRLYVHSGQHARIDTVSNDEIHFGTNSSVRFKATSAGLDINSGHSLTHNGTTVLDSSRVLQNVTANANIITAGTIDSDRLATGASGNWWAGNVVKVRTDGVMEIGKYIDFHNTDTATSDFDVRLQVHSANKLSISGGGRILTTNDEGSGNGLDADTVDGVEASSFLRSDTADTATGNITLGASTKLIFGNNTAYGIGAGGHNYRSGYFDTLESGGASDPLELVYYQGNKVNIGGSGGNKPLSAGSFEIGGTEVISSGRAVSGTSFTASSTDGFNLPSSGYVDWANGDARIIEGETENYSLSFQTYNGSSLTTGMRIDGNNSIHMLGDVNVNEYIYHEGDTNTYLRFTGDAITMRAGGKDMINIIEGSDDYVEIDGRLQMRDGIDLKMFHSSTTSGANIHMPRAGMITFYGDTSIHHGIGSRNQTMGEADDIMISSYGSVFIDLDSNSNNTSGANFVVGRHNSNGGNRLHLDGEDGDLVVAGDVTAFGSPSDIKLKENIETIDNPIDKVKELRGVTFNYKKDGKKSTGLIAQELEKVLPEVVYETNDIDNEEDKFKAVRYGNIVGLLVEAIKEQQKEIDELKEQVKGGTNGDN